MVRQELVRRRTRMLTVMSVTRCKSFSNDNIKITTGEGEGVDDHYLQKHFSGNPQRMTLFYSKQQQFLFGTLVFFTQIED